MNMSNYKRRIAYLGDIMVLGKFSQLFIKFRHPIFMRFLGLLLQPLSVYPLSSLLSSQLCCRLFACHFDHFGC